MRENDRARRLTAPRVADARRIHETFRGIGRATMTEKHHGSCQCGAIDFDVEISLDTTVACNCSRCRRLGSVLAFAPRTAFTLNSDPAALTEYLFNKNVIRHQFCRVCGIEPFAYGQMPDGTPMVAINVNCLDSLDARSLASQQYDGAAA
jgi:hypothetical protein